MGWIRFRLISDRESRRGKQRVISISSRGAVSPRHEWIILSAIPRGESRGKVGLPFLRLENDHHSDFTPPPLAILIRSISIREPWTFTAHLTSRRPLVTEIGCRRRNILIIFFPLSFWRRIRKRSHARSGKLSICSEKTAVSVSPLSQSRLTAARAAVSGYFFVPLFSIGMRD